MYHFTKIAAALAAALTLSSCSNKMYERLTADAPEGYERPADPLITSVGTTTVDGTYGAGEVIAISITYDTPVVVQGSPSLLLNSGGAATYSSGSGSNVINFTYTIAMGESSSDLEVTEISGGNILHAQYEQIAASRVLPTAGSPSSLSGSKNIVIDAVLPYIASISTSTSNGAYKAGDAIDVTLTFSEALTLSGGTLDITLDTGAIVSIAAFTSQTTASGTYTVASGENSLDLTVTAINLSGGATLQNAGSENALIDIPAAQNLSDNASIVIDTIAPVISSITSATANGSYAAAANIDVTVNFSEAVTLAGGNLVVTLDTTGTATIGTISAANTASGTYTVATGETSADLAATAMALSAGTLTDAAGNAANLALPATNISTGSDIVIDTTVPTYSISYNQSGNTAGPFVNGSLQITVTYSEAISPAPTLSIDQQGSADISLAAMDSLGGNAYRYTYAIQQDDASAYIDGNATVAVSATSDAAGNTATLSGSNTFEIVTIAPTYTLSFEQGTNTTGPFKAGNVTVTATFSIAPTDTPAISINQPGTADISSVNMSGSGTEWTYTYSVIANDGSAYVDGQATTSVVAHNASIAAILTGSGDFTIDTTAPTVSYAIGNPATGAYKQGQSVPLEIVFSENILLTGGSASLELSDTVGTASCSSAAAATLSCTYAVAAGVNSNDLNYAATSSLTLDSGVYVRDAAGNSAVLTLPATASADSLAGRSAIRIDTTAPTLSVVSIASDNNHTETAKAGDTITLSFNSAENISTPTVSIAGNTAAVSGSGTSWTATYTMQATDSTGAVGFNIAFTDIAGNAGVAVSTTTDASAVTFDKTQPIIDTAALESGNTYIDITFNENVYTNANGSGDLDAADFAIDFQQNGGLATAASISSVTRQSQSVWRVNLSLTGAPDGNETIEVFPAANAIYDYSGNLASLTATTGLMNLNATNIANIMGGTLEANNAYVDVTFDEGVYGNNSASAPVDAADFQILFTQNGGNATAVTVASVTNDSGGALTGNETTVRVLLSITGTPSGVEFIEIRPANGSSIYSSAGGATPATNSTGVKVLKDKLAPSVVNVTSSSADGTYGAGSVLTIQAVFSEEITVASGTPTLTLETGTVDAVVAATSITSGTTMNFTYTVATGETSADLDYKATDSLAANGATIADAAGNAATLTLGSPAGTGSLSANKAIVIEGNPVGIVSAATMDVDADGLIDHYKLTFSRNVDDSTFPGYVDSATMGNVITSWDVFNYTGVRLDPTVAADTDDDNILYLAFTEGATHDTGLKPNITTTASPGLIDYLGNAMGQLFTADLAEADGASPVVVSASGTVGGTSLKLTFSEVVYGDAGAPDCSSGGQLVASDFSYTNTSGGHASSVSGMDSDTCADDKSVTVTLNAALASADAVDSIALTANAYDASNNAGAVAGSALTLTNGPTLLSAVAYQNTTIHVTYDAAMVAGSATGTAECSGASACFEIYKIPGITITSAVAADSGFNATAGTASAYFILTSSSMEEGSLYTLTIPAGSVRRNSDNVAIENINNTANFFGDGLPLVSATSNSNCTDVYVQYDQAMTTGSGTAADNVDEPTNYRVIQCTGTCNPPYDTASTTPVGANTASWNSTTEVATAAFNTMHADGVYTIEILNAKDTNGNPVGTGLTTTVNGCASPDTVKPVLVNASAPDANHVLLTFSEAVDLLTSDVAGNYSITGLTVSTSERQGNQSQVLLTTSAQGGASYTVTVNNVTDLYFNEINENGVDNTQPFIGAGSSGIPQNFDGGPVYEDPFNDAVTAGQIVRYDGKLYVGPSTTHGAIFEMSYDMGSSTTITLDADPSLTGAQSFLDVLSQYSVYNSDNSVEGIDMLYSACIGATPTSLTGTDCTAAGGTENLFIGSRNLQGMYRSFWHTSNKSSSGLTFVFTEKGNGFDAGNVTFRSTGMFAFKDQLFFASAAEGCGGGRITRICLKSGGCADGLAENSKVELITYYLRRFGQCGNHDGGIELENGTQRSGRNELVGASAFWEYDNDAAGTNESQFYIANGGTYLGTLDTNPRSGNSDGGVLRTKPAYSTTSSLPGQCSGTANCDTYWEDITPDANDKWSLYMSIPYPRNAQTDGVCNTYTVGGTEDWDCIKPWNVITPSMKAIPYFRTAPNGDLYMVRNACSVTTVCETKKTHNPPTSCDIAQTGQVCPLGYEIPQIWMLPKAASGSYSTATDWVLVAEAGSSGRSDMSGNTDPAECGSAPNKCLSNSHISMLEFNGDYMYVGFDNPNHGLNMWKVDMSTVNSGSTPTETAFTLVSPGFGIGDSSNTRIFNHLTINDGSKDYLVVVTRNGSNAIKIYRTNND